MEYIIGVFLAIFLEWTKTKLKISGLGTMVVLFLLALVASLVYTWLAYAGYWETVAQVLVMAGAFHNFIIRQVKP